MFALSKKRLLEPTERISEALFGLIMALTFTGSLSVADAGREDVRAMLIGALGCNVAWGIIDGLFYLMDCLTEQARASTGRPRLGKEDWLAALSVFLWVFATTFPIAIPFFFFDSVARAMRVSNLIAIVLLFLTGYAFGRVTRYRPWLTGLAMVVFGSVLVSITIALGG